VPTIFTRIINGEIPGRFVWNDDDIVAFLTIEPMMPGHTLVVTREEIDHWIDVEPDLSARLFHVAQQIGKAQDAEWHPRRIGVMIVGEEVPHVHVHVVPFNSPGELSFAHADRHASSEALDDAAERIRTRLRELGHGAHVPDA
jgi:histidine triad (HIT) family protein